MVSTDLSAAGAPLRAAFWMSCAAALFTGMVVCVRLLSDTMSVFEINFFRAVIGLIVMLPLIAQRGVGTMRTKKLPLYMLRTMLGSRPTEVHSALRPTPGHRVDHPLKVGWRERIGVDRRRGPPPRRARP